MARGRGRPVAGFERGGTVGKSGPPSPDRPVGSLPHDLAPGSPNKAVAPGVQTVWRRRFLKGRGLSDAPQSERPRTIEWLGS